METRIIRLSKVAKELNVGKDTLIECLKQHGHEVDPNPNTIITPEEYDILKREFEHQSNESQALSPIHIRLKAPRLVGPTVLESMKETDKEDHLKEGEKVRVRINKIRENGCFCTFLPIWRDQFGFMPNNLMPSFFDENGDFTKTVGDNIIAVIYKITEKGILLSDVLTWEQEQERQRKKEEKELEKKRKAEERKRMKALVESCASQFERGTIYEAVVTRLSNQVAKISVNGIEGYIEKGELNWSKNDSVKESLFEGEVIHAVFLEYTDGKLLFGLKYLEEKPYSDDWYSLSTMELLNKLGLTNNVFIAESKNIKGLCLTNLYSEDGNLLLDPFKGCNVIVRYVQPTIEEGKFYKVQVNLINENKRRDSNDLFAFYVTDAEEVANPYKSDVEKAFSWHDSPASNSSLANILDTVGLEMYSSAERMFFELIQNADDAASQQGVIINIDKKDNYLIFTHNGFHFSYKDFESLVSAAKSTKSSKEKTGYKGIGFKSVFTNSQQVFVDSGGYHFKFDKNELLFEDFDKFYSVVRNIKDKFEMSLFIDKYTSQRETFRGVKDIPWQLLPIWYDDVPDSLKKSAFAKNQKVSFALNIKNQKIEDYVKAIEYLFDNPKFILFLRHTNRLDLKFANKTISKDVKDGIVTIKNSFASKRTEELIKMDFEDIPISNEAFDDKNIDIKIKEITNRQGEKEKKFYDTNDQELEDIPDRIASSLTTTISFVAKYDDNTITENHGNSLYAYLPMNEHRFRFPFFINADFVLAANRETLLDNPWNYYLLANIGELLVKWVAELAKKGERNCLKLLPLKYFDDSTLDVEQLAQSFNSAYRIALESTSFILNHKDTLSKQDEIILDIPGLSQLIGPDMFCKIMGTEKCLPSAHIDSKILKENIFEKIEKPDLEDVLEAISDNSVFNAWFVSATDEQKETFYRWINWIKEKGYEPREGCLDTLISNLPLFKFGDEYKSSKEIRSDACFVSTEHIAPIIDVLRKLNIKCSDSIFDKSHPLYEFIKVQDESELYKTIKGCDFSGLDVAERKALFIALKDFSGVGESKLKEIALFKNKDGEFKPLGEMGCFKEGVSKWLFPYVLCEGEYYEELSDYLITDDEFFAKIVWKHKDEYPGSLFDFYVEQKWTDEKYTQQIIRENKGTAKFKELLPIVECYGRESDAKKMYLQYIDKLDLLQNAVYDKDSYEYRVLRLALSVYEDPTVFSSKVHFDGQCIKDFSVSDDVECKYRQNGEEKALLLSLAKILPKYQNLSDQIDKVKNCFDIDFDDKTELDHFFNANVISDYDIYRELKDTMILENSYKKWVPATKYRNGYYKTETILKWRGNPTVEQYLFVAIRGVKQLSQIDGQSDQFLSSLLDVLFKEKIQIQKASFTDSIKDVLNDKYFNCVFVAEEERLLPVVEQWADTVEKKQYLFQNGVKDETDKSILFRKSLIEDKPFSDELSDKDLVAGINYVAISDSCNKPFVGENQKKILLSLRRKEGCKLNTEVNWSKLNEESAEWGIPEYKTWIEDHSLHIYIYDGLMPKLLFYNNVLLLSFKEKHYAYDKSQQRLFVEKGTIQKTLLKAIDDKDIPFDASDYSSLFSIISKEDYETLKGENEELKKKVEELEKQLKINDEGASDTNSLFKSSVEEEGGFLVEESENDERQHTLPPTIKSGTSSPIGEKEQWEAQLEAQKRLMQEFPDWGFPYFYGKCDDNGKPYNYSTIEVEDENGRKIPVVLKSYKRQNEPFKINTEEWDFLIKEDADLLIYTGSDIKRILVRDLIMDQTNIVISFSTENLDIEERIDAFAESLHYFKELHFDFDSFNISEKAESVADIYKKNERGQYNNDNTEADI